MENDEAERVLREYASMLEKELYGGEIPFSEVEKAARLIAALYLGADALKSHEA